MKKLLALILVLIMSISLCACGETTENENGETENSEVIEKIVMTYGTDPVSITLYKPEGAEFDILEEDPLNAGDIAGVIADDLSWDAELFGYVCYDIEIQGDEPFVDYHYLGKIRSDMYESYVHNETDAGISYEGKPVTLIRYEFKEYEDEETYKQCFIGFEYDDMEDGEHNGKGLMGMKIAGSENLTDSDIINLFSEVFGLK